MRTKFNGILTLLIAFVVHLSFAQEKTISGIVSDDSGLPLPGATVLVKGTVTGTSSDFDGKYAIKASQGSTLVFSFVGYTTKEVLVGASNTINITLSEDAEALEEVVIVGYGTSTKEAFAGTASVVDAKNIEIKNVSNVSQALAGESAGVTVINTSGQPGTVSTIRIRGFGSVNGNRAPLYVVDGVPIGSTTSLNSINPADIASTTVLKDATATAIYGSRGANGVILITTKKGDASDVSVEFDIKSGVNVQLLPTYDVMTNPEQYISAVWDGIYNRGVVTGEADPVAYANSNLISENYLNPAYNMWNVADGSELIDPTTRQVRDGVTRRYTPLLYSDAAFDTAYRTESNLRISGGSETSNYFISLGYLNDNGYAIETGYDRYNARLNLNSDVKKWLTVGANVGYTYSESKNNGQTEGSENLFEFANKMAPIFPVFLRDSNYNLVEDPIYGGYVYDYGDTYGRPNALGLNPIASAKYDYVGTDRHEVTGNFSATIKFSDHLQFETRFGNQYSISRYKSYDNAFYGTGVSNGGSLYTIDQERTTYNFLQLLRYNNDFGSHSLEVLAAHESNEYKYKETTQYKGLMIVPDLLELDNFVNNLSDPTGFTEGATIESYFAQVNYDYDNKYFLTGSLRTDGSSRFVNDKWGTFGSIGAAWVASKESFLQSDLITFLKLKASYGITGDQAGADYYSGYDTYDTGILDGAISISARDVGNPNLTWETSKMTQAGVEFSLGNFLDGNIDYYIKDTENLFFDRSVGPSVGYSEIEVNDGELRNSGLEFDFTVHITNTKDLKLDFAINGAVYNNELTKMPIDPATEEQKTLDIDGYYGYSVGRSIFDFYMREWAGVDPSNGAPLWYQYFDDINGNDIFDTGDTAITEMVSYMQDNPDANIERQATDTYADATQKYINKSAIPDLRGAFRLSGEYKNFNFSTQFIYSLGGHGYDWQYSELMSDRFGALGNNYHVDIDKRWQEPGDITDVPALTDNAVVNSTSTSSRFITKTDYFGLNSATIGYTFPKHYLVNTGLQSMNVFVSGDNLFLSTARGGFNPTTSENGESERYFYSPLSTFTMGIRFKF